MIIKPSVIGLGYVGLPLFLKLQKNLSVLVTTTVFQE